MQEIDLLGERKYGVNTLMFFIELCFYFLLNILGVFLLCSTSFAMFYSIKSHDDLDFVLIILQIISLVIVYSGIMIGESIKRKTELLTGELSRVFSHGTRLLMTFIIIVTIVFFGLRSIEVMSKTKIIPKSSMTNLIGTTEIIVVEKNRKELDSVNRLKSYIKDYANYVTQYSEYLKSKSITQ